MHDDTDDMAEASLEHHEEVMEELDEMAKASEEFHEEFTTSLDSNKE